MKTETLLLLEKRTLDSGVVVFVVGGQKEDHTFSFLSEEDAFRYIKTQFNGASSPGAYPAEREAPPSGGKKTRLGFRQANHERKRQFLMELLKKAPGTVNDIKNKAAVSPDPYIQTVPYGTWSGMTSLLYRKHQLAVVQKNGAQYVYSARPEGSR